jgi:hypothetical protein
MQEVIEPWSPAAALSWLRRRGPDLPDSVLHRLFRRRQVWGRRRKAANSGCPVDDGVMWAKT